MPELRWTLLIVGVVFLAALAWRELRRPRLAPREDLNEPALPPAHVAKEAPAADERREPALNLPEIHVTDGVHEVPVVEIADDSMIGLRIDGSPETAEPVVLAEEAEAIVPSEPESQADSSESATAPVVATAEMPDPVVEWPEETSRRIVAIRIVAPMDRFPGHAVRQALAAEGFVLGKFSIFHRAGPDGRALMSVASLTKPGTFDRDSIDLQRFGGLNLFTVLPGSLAPGTAFEELLGAARSLNDRLQGALQDERGEPLTPVRVASIRDALLTDTHSGVPVAPS